MQKRYWLRGGVIFLVINLIIAVILYFNYQYENSRSVDNSDIFAGFLQLGSIFFIPISFVFGSFIGWLYGKTKNKIN